MQADIQKAIIWKRLAAWILDVILVVVLTSSIMWGLTALLQYDKYEQQFNDSRKQYAAQYGLTEEEISSVAVYKDLSEEKQAKVKEAEKAMGQDPVAVKAWNMMVSLILLMITVGLLISMLLLYVGVPLLLKNGQTIGKKAFALGVIRQDGVKMNNLQLFVRTLLGQFTIETMIPVYIVLMIYANTIGLLGTVVLFLLFIGQIICMGVTQNNAALHDLLACTTVVDLASQKVFESQEALIEYTKQVHAERAARQDY